MIQIHIKNYNELTTEELYSLLQLRSQVFVVEQNCVYQDIDGKDQKSLHVLGKKDNVLVAYSRIFKEGDYFKESSIGRVVVDKNSRHLQYGSQIMQASIEAIQNTFDTKIIKISAQLYLENFYTGFGFKPTGNSYLEDGIPHVAMIKN
jgi:ElaA protein